MTQDVLTYAQSDDILARHDYDPEHLITILRETQDAYGYLPERIIAHIASGLKMPASAIYGVATFYSHFTLEPKGKHLIKVCDGTACHVKKSTGLLEAIGEELGISPAKKTSNDRLFTLETVACLGACGLAPVMVVDDKVYGAMTPEKTTELLRSIKAQEAENG